MRSVIVNGNFFTPPEVLNVCLGREISHEIEFRLKNYFTSVKFNTVENEHTFYNFFRTSIPDVVIADFTGNNISGCDILEYCNNNYPDIPVIIYSDNANENDALNCFEMGAYEFITNDSVFKIPFYVKFILEKAAMEREKRYAQTELVKSEQRYRSLFRNNNCIMLIIDPKNGSIVDANAAATSFYGWSHSQLILKNITEINILSEENVLEEMRTAKRFGKNYFNFKHRLADGSVRDVEVYSGPINVEDKVLLYSIIHDVTKRKAAEEKLRKSEENQRITLESIGDAVISTDRSGNVRSMNPVAENLTGWDSYEAIGRKMQEIFRIYNSGTGDKVEDPVLKVLNSGKIVGLANHTELISKNGEKFQIADSAAPINDDNGEIKGVVLVFRDVTEKYNREQAILELQTQLLQAQKLVSLGSWEFDLNTGKVKASQVAREVYGVEGELTIDYVQNIPLKEYRELLDNAFYNLINNNEVYDVEFKIKRNNDGAIRDVHSVAEYYPEDNKILGTIHDITNEKEKQRDMEYNLERFKTLWELSNLTETTEDELYDFLLEKGIEISGSEIGFIGFVSEGGEHFTVNRWSEDVLDVCNVQKKVFDFEIESGGLWAEAIKNKSPVIVNNCKDSGLMKNSAPTGHAEVKNFAGIPLVQNGRVTTMFALANKEGGYTELDEKHISLLLDGVQKIIAQQKNSEEISRQKKLLETTFDTISDGIVITDTDRRIIHANKGMKTTFGYDPEDLIGEKTAVFYADVDKFEKAGEHVFNKRADKGRDKYLTYYKDKNGRIFPGETFGSKIYDRDGKWVGNVGVMRDVSERENRISEIGDLNYRLTTVNEINHILLSERNDLQLSQKLCDYLVGEKKCSGALILLNKNNDNIFAYSGLNPKAIEMVQNDTNIFKCIKNIGGSNERIQVLEKTCVRCGDCNLGNIFYGDSVLIGSLGYENIDLGYICVGVPDNSENTYDFYKLLFPILKEMVSEISGSLYRILSRERQELLVNELFHRTRNSLQLIISMLNLKENFIRDSKVHEVLKSIESNIYSMALAHKNLYKSKGLNYLETEAYVRDLSEMIFDKFNINGTINSSIDKHKISIDSAVPLGIVFTEILSNTIRILGHSNIKVSVELFINNGGFLNFFVTVNGYDLKSYEEYEVDESVIALEIIETVVNKQLDGTFGIDTDDSRSTFMVTLPPKMYVERV